MASVALNDRLDKEIAELQRRTGTVDAQDLLEVIQTVVDSIGNDLDCGPLKVYAEVSELATYIKTAREDISALCPSEITEEHLPTASDELDAIVEATEQATNSIFEAVEGIEGIAANLPEETATQITDHVTAVYEACSFQDITGQRINKVVNTLKHIEARIEEIMVAFNAQHQGEDRPHSKRPSPVEDARPDAHLMNGPQAEGEAISQDDIDALLGFD